MKLESKSFFVKKPDRADSCGDLETAVAKEQIEPRAEAAGIDAQEAIQNQSTSEMAQLKQASAIQEAADKAAADRIFEKLRNGNSTEKIEPDHESDPTLTLFERVNNPIIKKQMIDLLLKNEQYKVSEMQDTWEDVLDQNGNPVFDDTTYTFLRRNVGMKPRYPGYVQKTQEELTKEVEERLRAVTQLGGENNAVYLHPEGYLDIKESAYSPIDDEVHIHNEQLPGSKENLTPQQMAVVLAHEKGHQLRRYDETYLNQTFRGVIDWENIKRSPEDMAALGLSEQEVSSDDGASLREYFDAREILERMSQIKNYFGFKGDEPFTQEHLNYAREHYVKDVGFDNNMNVFFRAITSEKEKDFIEGMNTLGV